MLSSGCVPLLFSHWPPGLFFPSRQKCRLKGSDILKEKDGRSSRRKAHETSPEVCQSKQTILSSRTVALCRLSKTVTASGDLDGAHRDHTGRGHQTGPRGLPLSRPPLCGI